VDGIIRLLYPRRQYLLNARFSPAEARARLRAHVEAQRAHGMRRLFEVLGGGRSVRGTFSAEGFTLTIPNWWWHHNAPYWRLRGTFDASTDETRLALLLSPHPIYFLLTTALPALLFLPVVFLGAQLHPLAGVAIWALVVALFAGVFRLFPLADKLLVKESEDERLLRFLREALDAEIVRTDR
jgi:hypothetical protein